MVRILKGSHSFTCTPTCSSAIGMSHTCLCIPSYSWYSFTDPGGMEGWVGLGGWLRSETVYLPVYTVTHPTTNRAQCSNCVDRERPTRYCNTKSLTKGKVFPPCSTLQVD